MTDQQLLNQVQKKHSAAFTRLFDRYWEILFNAAYNMVRDEEAAKDIVQEIMIQLWEKPERKIQNLKSYLLQSVKYQSFAHLRKVKKVGELVNDYQEIIAANQTEEEIFVQELNGSLQKIIQDLPEKCRKIFQMSRFEQMKNAEIAKKMNIKEKTVENQINKALNYLRETLITLIYILITIF